jgi:dihydrofolate reductase
MGKLVYLINMSLDGYIEDAGGSFDWTEPSPEVHRFIGDLIRSAPVYLYGRRMYETMSIWDSDDWIAGQPDYMQEFAAIWRPAEKVVYSRTLQQASTGRTRIESAFDPEAVRRMKDQVEGDILIGGPNLAAQAIEAGLVDEYVFFVLPVAVGGGKPALPLDRRLDLELIESRLFDSGTFSLRYPR